MSTISRGFHCQLYVKPKPRAFRAADAEPLAEHLTLIDRQTTLLPVASVRELQLDQQGTTLDGGYRYTTSGFAQVAQMLGRGAVRLIPDLAGTLRSLGSRDEYIDGRLAVRIFNELIDLRFPMFADLRLVRNDETRTLDGLISSSHHVLENLRFYREVTACLGDRCPNWQFKGALLLGRRLLLWFADPTPPLNLQIGGQRWPFYSGCYFCNGESTGTSVRGTAAILLRCGVCLAPYYSHGGRVNHSGRTFERRFAKLMEDVTTAQIRWDEIEQNVLRLAALPLTPQKHDERSISQRVRKLAGSFAQLGVPLRFGREIMERAVYAGAATEREPFFMATLQQRTLFDILLPLVEVARSLDPVRREALEIAAFEFLSGKLKYEEL